MKTTIKEITPQWAAKVLETRNPNNRKLSEIFVAKIARDISCGAFLETHQGIAFDENGDLLDGQHRLAAVVKANKPITIPVTTGVPTTHKLNGSTINTFEVIDGGKPRSVGAMLQMAGFINGNRVAAAVKAAVLFCSRHERNIGMSTAQCHKALMYIGNSVSRCTQIGSSGNIIRPPSYIIGVVSFWHTIEPEKAETFLNEVSDVTGATGSPSRALASYIKHNTTAGGSCLSAFSNIAATAIMHECNGQKISKLYQNQNAKDFLISKNKALAFKLAQIIG